MFDRDYHFAIPGVVSVSSVCDGDVAREIRMSDYVRSETLRRCMAIPSYPHKSLAWKNRYYELIQRRVKAEVYNA